MIGTLNEGPLHHALKALYGGTTEVVLAGGFVADVRADDDVIYEIQTAGFGAIRRKLGELLRAHRVVLVHPIARMRYIVKLDGADERVLSRRRSPRRGAVSHVVAELVSIPELLAHPNFELEVVLVDEDEYRVHDPDNVRRRNGWRVVRRDLLEVVELVRFRSPSDLLTLLSGSPPATFTTLDLATALGQPRWVGQKLAYCLRASGVVEVAGKQGNALVYRQA
jgi:hypothetical protein